MNNIVAILSQAAERVRSELRLKLLLLIILNLWVYLPYYFLQRHHFFPPTAMPASVLDNLIPFREETVWLYLSIYLLMPIGPFLMNQRTEILRYAMGTVLIGLAADLIFLFWPTFCARPASDGSGAAYRILTTVDNPFHACPSLHAAFTVFSALCAGRVFGELRAPAVLKGGIWIWAFLILLATLTTKQHVLMDVAAGSGLAFGAYFFVFHWWTSIPKMKARFPTLTANATQPKSTVL